MTAATGSGVSIGARVWWQHGSKVLDHTTANPNLIDRQLADELSLTKLEGKSTATRYGDFNNSWTLRRQHEDDYHSRKADSGTGTTDHQFYQIALKFPEPGYLLRIRVTETYSGHPTERFKFFGLVSIDTTPNHYGVRDSDSDWEPVWPPENGSTDVKTSQPTTPLTLPVEHEIDSLSATLNPVQVLRFTWDMRQLQVCPDANAQFILKAISEIKGEFRDIKPVISLVVKPPSFPEGWRLLKLAQCKAACAAGVPSQTKDEKDVKSVSSTQINFVRLNVLLMGEPGSGKTSLLNSIAVALSPPSARGLKFAAIGGPTDKLSIYRVGAEADGLCIYLYDMWGWSNPADIEPSVLVRNLIRGCIPIDCSKSEYATKAKPRNVSVDERIHCVIFAVKGGLSLLRNPDHKEFVSRFGLYRNCVLENDVRAVVAVTGIDRCDAKLTGLNPVADVFSSTPIAEEIQSVSALTSFQMAHVFPVIENNAERDLSVDALALSVIAEAASLARLSRDEIENISIVHAATSASDPES